MPKIILLNLIKATKPIKRNKPTKKNYNTDKIIKNTKTFSGIKREGH